MWILSVLHMENLRVTDISNFFINVVSKAQWSYYLYVELMLESPAHFFQRNKL